ncbi:MAG: electron transfer flavoprotein beta subunit/FixA family protein [Anaerolineales bacterium]|nr:electron transfer flavoprotein beta subunit/FixA family protein [Anaerolineales bacterium]
MNIIVCMKQVIDLEQIRIKPETREPIIEGLPYLFGEYDKCALEEAVRLKEKLGGKVIALAAGAPKLKETIKEALAIGADEAAIMIDPAFQGSDTMGSAHILAKAIEKIGDWDLILLGDSSADEYSGEIPPRIAEALDLPVISAVREIEPLIESDQTSEVKRLRVVRDVENALEVIEVDLPVVIGVTSELNTPRLAPLSAILKASRKPLHEWGPDELGIAKEDVGSSATVVQELSNLAPVHDRQGNIYDDVEEGIAEVVKALQQEGVLAR